MSYVGTFVEPAEKAGEQFDANENFTFRIGNDYETTSCNQSKKLLSVNNLQEPISVRLPNE